MKASIHHSIEEHFHHQSIQSCFNDEDLPEEDYPPPDWYVLDDRDLDEVEWEIILDNDEEDD